MIFYMLVIDVCAHRCARLFGSTEHIFTSSSLTTEMGMRNNNSKQLQLDPNFMKETGIILFFFFFYLQKPSAEAAQQD